MFLPRKKPIERILFIAIPASYKVWQSFEGKKQQKKPKTARNKIESQL